MNDYTDDISWWYGILIHGAASGQYINNQALIKR